MAVPYPIKEQQKISESTHQICLFRWAAYQTGKWPELNLMYHIPNEGKRSRATGGRMRAEGLKPGVPDVCLPVARGRFHGLYIEMKAGSNKTTKNQDYWLEALAAEGYLTAVCYGWEAAAQKITEYMNLKREV